MSEAVTEEKYFYACYQWNICTPTHIIVSLWRANTPIPIMGNYPQQDLGLST